MTDKIQNPTLFLEKRSYRRRRMMDALRLLPIVGIMLWVLPVFWPTGQDGPNAPAPFAMSSAITYVFFVWALVILAGLALWWALRRPADDSEAPERTP